MPGAICEIVPGKYMQAVCHIKGAVGQGFAGSAAASVSTRPDKRVRNSDANRCRGSPCACTETDG